MNEDQEQKLYICRFCKQGFSNGKKLGGHMRRHLALIAAGRNQKSPDDSHDDDDDDVDEDNVDDQVIKKARGVNQDYDANSGKQSMQENNQEVINGDVMVNKSQQEMDVDQDCKANAYVLRENPKRSWRVSNSSKDCGELSKKRCDSRTESVKNCVCDKCGKGFSSMKALYGHMRCHSIKRSRQFDESSSLMTSSGDHHDDGEVATPVRKKRSCTRYKSPKRDHVSSGLSCSDDEVEKGAMCLMMLSRGVTDLGEEVKMVNSNQSVQSNVVFEVSVDGSIDSSKLKKSKLGLKKDLIVESGSGQLRSGQAGSTRVKSKSPKKPRLCDQDFGDMDVTDSGISTELKRRSKDHNSPICLKECGSGQALGCHKRVNNSNPDVHRHVNSDLPILGQVYQKL